jgi:hypothetical protein
MLKPGCWIPLINRLDPASPLRSNKSILETPLAITAEGGIISGEMSGIFFDLPSLRFLRRFRFFETMMRTLASFLIRLLRARVCGSRQVHFRLNEAEFPAASHSACRLSESTMGDSRAADSASIGALRTIKNWINLKDQHELLFIWETVAPVARWVTTEGRPRTLSGSARGIESTKKDILAAGGRFFWKRQGRRKENAYGGAQWCGAFPPAPKT